MKIMVYEVRPDEQADLEQQAALHGVELAVTDAVPTLENAALAAGCAGVSILGQGRIDAALLDALAVAVAERLGFEGTNRLQALHQMKKDYFPDG